MAICTGNKKRRAAGTKGKAAQLAPSGSNQLAGHTWVTTGGWWNSAWRRSGKAGAGGGVADVACRCLGLVPGAA